MPRAGSPPSSSTPKALPARSPRRPSSTWPPTAPTPRPRRRRPRRRPGGPAPRRGRVIGSGPIVIGQAAEFDYAGVQACPALRGEGGPAGPGQSEPATRLTPRAAGTVVRGALAGEHLAGVVDGHRPDALLPTLGGQTGLNLAVALDDAGILERFRARVLGTAPGPARAAGGGGGGTG